MSRIYENGTILTMEKQLYEEAVCVEAGRIAAVGKGEELRSRYPKAERVSLEGGTLMPGFIDAHSHLSQMAASRTQVDLAGVENGEELEARIRSFIEKNHPGEEEWILCAGFDPTETEEGKGPSLMQMDGAAMGRPLAIQQISGHAGYFNSKALSLLNVTRETQAPGGGKIEQKDGALTGYMEENAFIEYLKQIPMAGPEKLLAAFDQAQREYAAYGITTIQEGLMVEQLVPLYQTLTSQDRLWMDVVAYPDRTAYAKAAEAFKDSVGKYSRHMKLGGLKVILDGSPQARTAWMRQPYEGEKDYRGYGAMEDEALRSILAFAGERGLQVLAHCNGDEAAAQLIRCMDWAQKKYPILADRRPVMIHAQLVSRDQLADMKRLKILPSFFIAHIGRWGEVHVKNFGLARGAYISPAASAMQAGLTVTFHQDAPVIRPDMLETVSCAVNRVTEKGRVLAPEERISALDALKAVTCNAAYQYFEEGEKGSIAPGKKANFVLLSENPLTCPGESLNQIRVLQTILEGKTIYRA